MAIFTSSKALKRFLESFTFEDIGFIRIDDNEDFIAYHKKRRHRSDLLARVCRKTLDAQLYRCNTDGQPESLKGTFNIRRPDEVLFMLTHCLNELRTEPAVLEECKQAIGYEQTNVVPGRSPKRL